MNRTSSRPNRKAKRSYTLSPDIVAFLEEVRIQRHAESVSSVLEDILENVRQQHERAGVERAVSDYYSSLKDSEKGELALWGEFAFNEFASREHS